MSESESKANARRRRDRKRNRREKREAQRNVTRSYKHIAYYDKIDLLHRKNTQIPDEVSKRKEFDPKTELETQNSPPPTTHPPTLNNLIPRPGFTFSLATLLKYLSA
jgi:hypothetical protein